MSHLACWLDAFVCKREVLRFQSVASTSGDGCRSCPLFTLNHLSSCGIPRMSKYRLALPPPVTATLSCQRRPALFSSSLLFIHYANRKGKGNLAPQVLSRPSQTPTWGPVGKCWQTSAQHVCSWPAAPKVIDEKRRVNR
ncbi:hypothetical protein GN956_G18701 [Arapaima gigas]